MASLRTQNALLFVIALCLVLLVVHVYSGHLVAKAQAQPVTEAEDPSGPKEMRLYGENCPSGGTDKQACQWVPIQVNTNGVLLFSSADPVSKVPQDVNLHAWGCKAFGADCGWKEVKLDTFGYLRTTTK